MGFQTESSGERKPSLWLFLSAICALCSAASMGAILGWSSPSLPSYARNGSEPQLGDNEQDKFIKSWIGSAVTLGALFGALIGGPLVGYIGMKKTIIGVGVPFVVGWACILFTKAVPLIMVGRVVTGFGAGISCAAAPTYVNHISTPGIKGLLGTGFQIFVNIGIIYIQIFGIFEAFDWRWICIPGVIPSIAMSVGMLFMPESPTWLINKYGKCSQVVDSLKRLRSEDSDIEGELKELQERADAQKATASGFSLGQISRGDVYKPLIIASALMFFQQFAGINAVLFYAADIFKSAGSKIDPNVNSVIVTGSMVAAVLVGGLLIDKLGRKILLLVSGSGHVISLILMGYYFFQKKQHCPHELEDCTAPLGWLPVVSLIFFVIMFSIGFGPIPWLLVAEITPGFALSFISSIATGTNWLCAFIVTLTFEKIQDKSVLDKHGAFWLFAGFSAASVIFTALFVPESKGKTPEEMSHHFLGNKSSHTNGDKAINSA